MNRTELSYSASHVESRVWRYGPLPSELVNLVPMVTTSEVESMRNAVAAGKMPGDFEAKLQTLARGEIIHQAVERACRRFISLLAAERERLFGPLSPSQREKLLAVLAYVRRDEDVIPDYQPGGYMDDQQQIRFAMKELQPILDDFTAWLLANHVPGLWNFAPVSHSRRN